MRFPQLKYALLCRVLVYVLVLGGFVLPAAVVIGLPFVPEIGKVVAVITCAIGLLIYVMKNFALLMTIDVTLATLRCLHTSRKCFVLPKSFSAQQVERRISRFGKGYAPIALSPQPDKMRYRSSPPVTVYSSGIEKIFMIYHTDLLDKNRYHSIFHSAEANSKALEGKKKHLFLDAAQKSAGLNRVTVVMIFAHRVEEGLRSDLLKTVSKNSGDGYDRALLPCVVDLEQGSCTFDSLQIPYLGFQYPVKNRGIHMIRKYLFRGRLPLKESPEHMDPIRDLDPEQSLWDFWREIRKELRRSDGDLKKRFEKMENGQMLVEDGYLYLKWEDHGLWLAVELDETLRRAQVDPIIHWAYPKPHQISKATIRELKDRINIHFAGLGYTTEYITWEE